MKKILLSLMTLSIAATPVITVTACNNSGSKIIPTPPGDDKDISKDIVNLNSIDNKLIVHETTRYTDFNNDILNSQEVTNLKPHLGKNIKIQYFDKDLQRDITDLLVGPMQVKVIITVINDSYYHGKTLPLSLNLEQGKLDLSQHLTNLDSLLGKLSVTPGNNYFELSDTISQSKEFLNLDAPASNFIMDFYDQPNGKRITNDPQGFGTFYVIISAVTTPDNIYEGSTNPLKLTLNKIPLNKQITELDGPSFVPMDFNKIFSDWDNLIMNSHQIIALKTKLATGYQIHYYDKPNGQEITNRPQDRSHFYVVISSANNDPVYQGSTDFISVSCGKMDVSEYLQILQITSQKLAVNPNQQFKDLDKLVRNDWYITHMHMLLKADFKIHYFQDQDMLFEITNNNQTPGTFYISIEAASDDPVYQGHTKAFKMDFNKANLEDAIKDLDSFQDYKNNFDPTKEWNALDETVKAATQFKAIEKTLKPGYTIKYYDYNLNDVTYKQQNLSLFYIVITAAWNDPNYTGSTRAIGFVLEKMELNKYLTNLDPITNTLTADNQSTYKDLFGSIADNVPFFNTQFNPNYSPGWIIKYYSDSECKNEVTNNNQTPGDVWITIAAMSENNFYQGITKPLKINLL